MSESIIDIANSTLEGLKLLDEFQKEKEKYKKSNRLSHKQLERDVKEMSENDACFYLKKIISLFKEFGKSNQEKKFLQHSIKLYDDIFLRTELPKIQITNKQAFFEIINLMRKGFSSDKIIDAKGNPFKYLKPDKPIISGTLEEIALSLQRSFDLDMKTESIKKAINDPDRTSGKKV